MQTCIANTIVHELGHILGLKHRDDVDLSDNLFKPHNLNIMDIRIPVVDDLDLIQLWAMHHSTALQK